METPLFLSIGIFGGNLKVGPNRSGAWKTGADWRREPIRAVRKSTRYSDRRPPALGFELHYSGFPAFLAPHILARRLLFHLRLDLLQTHAQYLMT